MAIVLNSGSSTINGSVTVVADPTKKTVNAIDYTGTATTTQTLGTVPANKVWRILSAQVCQALNIGGASLDAAITVNGEVVVAVAGWRATTSGGGAISECVTWAYSACPVATATQTVQLTFPAGATVLCKAVVTYVEEAA